MKKGDLVDCYWASRWKIGIIVGFNKKGEGGKEFVHVFINGNIVIFQTHDLRKIDENT